MRALLIIACLALFTCAASGQDFFDDLSVRIFSRSSVIGEIGGNGGIYSISYEREFSWFIPGQLRWRAGVCVFPRDQLWTLTLPASIIKTFNKGKNCFVFGAGQTLILSNKKGGYLRGNFRIGYRRSFNCFRKATFQPYVEFAYTPFYSYRYNFQWDNWLGLSFGWRIKTVKYEALR